MDHTQKNKIEKHIELKAGVSRVWEALTDHRQFGEWFRVAIDSPFRAGENAKGRILHPGYEHLNWEVHVVKIEPEHYFAFTWHPYAVDPGLDYSSETPTLVEFRLEKVAHGTKLTLTESGFENIPAHRLSEAFRMNEGGWIQQLQNIGDFLAKN